MLCNIESFSYTYFIKFVGSLERNQHITLAHVNPECFNKPEQEGTGLCTMWFIGLVFAKTENLNVDLTYDIKTFTDAVHRQANNIKMFKEGMKIEARHVKRKQLHQYLSPSLLKRERKTSTGSAISTTPVTINNTVTSNTTTATNNTQQAINKNGIESRKRLSDNTVDFNMKKSRISEEVPSNVSSEFVENHSSSNSDDNQFFNDTESKQL